MLEDERWCTAWFLRDVQEGEFQCEISWELISMGSSSVSPRSED
jgi:hypothetical protein